MLALLRLRYRLRPLHERGVVRSLRREASLDQRGERHVRLHGEVLQAQRRLRRLSLALSQLRECRDLQRVRQRGALDRTRGNLRLHGAALRRETGLLALRNGLLELLVGHSLHQVRRSGTLDPLGEFLRLRVHLHVLGRFLSALFGLDRGLPDLLLKRGVPLLQRRLHSQQREPPV
jgi:hypothetical protein